MERGNLGPAPFFVVVALVQSFAVRTLKNLVVVVVVVVAIAVVAIAVGVVWVRRFPLVKGPKIALLAPFFVVGVANVVQVRLFPLLEALNFFRHVVVMVPVVAIVVRVW